MLPFTTFYWLVSFLLLDSVQSHDHHVIEGCNDDVTIQVVASARHHNNDCAPARVGKSGPKGDRGEIGPKGGAGDNGPKGNVGPKGEQGVGGLKGEKGEDADVCECITNQQLSARITYLEG